MLDFIEGVYRDQEGEYLERGYIEQEFLDLVEKIEPDKVG